MTEIIKGLTRFSEIDKGILKMEKPKYLRIDDFVELLFRFNHDIAIHMGGNYMNITRNNKLIIERDFPLRKKYVLYTDLDNIYYSPGKYHRYLVMSNKNKNGQKTIFQDDFPSPTDFQNSIKVIKYEDYELEGLDRHILRRIEEVEKIRNSKPSI